MFVKQGGKLKKIDYDSIIYVKAEQEYSMIVMQSKVLASKHLKLLMDDLPAHQFTRIHRSYVVAYDKISSIFANRVQMEDGTELPVGSTYKEDLGEKLNL